MPARYGVALTAGAALAPDRPEALQATFERGVARSRREASTRRRPPFGALLAQGSREPYVHNNLGIVSSSRAATKAVAEFREAVRLDPAYTAPRILLGASLLALGRVSRGPARASSAP